MSYTVSSGGYGTPLYREIGWSGPSLLVTTMTSPWYRRERDGSLEDSYGDEEYYRQYRIDPSSFKAANEVIPWTLEGYFEYARKLDPEISEEELTYSRGWLITREHFDMARDFIRHCALHNLDAHPG